MIRRLSDKEKAALLLLFMRRRAKSSIRASMRARNGRITRLMAMEDADPRFAVTQLVATELRSLGRGLNLTFAESKMLSDLATEHAAPIARALVGGMAIETIADKSAEAMADDIIGATADVVRLVARETNSMVMWVSEHDEKTCKKCRELDGQVFQPDAAPELPQHPNCRCALVSVSGASFARM